MTTEDVKRARSDTTVLWLLGDGFHQEDQDRQNRRGPRRRQPHRGDHWRISKKPFRRANPGCCIDHQYKTFVRIRYDPIGSNMYPHDYIRMIREGSYDVLADLGAKHIGDTKAHGYRLKLKNPHDEENLIRDPVELWVDAETDLPLEIGWSGGQRRLDIYRPDERFSLERPDRPERVRARHPQGLRRHYSPTEQK